LQQQPVTTVRDRISRNYSISHNTPSTAITMAKIERRQSGAVVAVSNNNIDINSLIAGSNKNLTSLAGRPREINSSVLNV